MSSSSERSRSHIALLPSSGMGHLMPFLRFAVSLTSHHVQVTLITAHPTVSLAESQTLSQFSDVFPQVTHQQMCIPPVSQSSVSSPVKDPFTLQYEAILRSSHILSPLLSSLCPPVSAIITDMTLASMVVPITKNLGLPNYIFFTSCAQMLAIYASYHQVAAGIDGRENFLSVPGLEPLPKSWIPPLLLSPGDNLFKTHFIENGKKFLATNGILVNTFEDLEEESLTALNAGLVVDHLPQVITIGPLAPLAFEKGEVIAWLDDQPPQSVIYVCFGTRAAISREQMRELAKGLVRCGFKFLWVVKSKMVDREDEEELEEIVGCHVFKELKKRGLLVKTWMEQERILSHTAIGGFLSHCGWNSITEAIWHGIPILAWPQNSDQKINAALAERKMVAKWDKSWGWGEKEIIADEEIAEKIKEMMEEELLRHHVALIRDKARRAVVFGGSSHKKLAALIKSLS